MAMPDPLDAVRRDRVDRGQDREQQREGDKYHLDPQQFGQQDFAGQRPLEIGRHRRPRLAFIAPPWTQHRTTPGPILHQSSVRRKRITAMVMAISINATSAIVSYCRFGSVAPFSMMARTIRT